MVGVGLGVDEVAACVVGIAALGRVGVAIAEQGVCVAGRLLAAPLGGDGLALDLGHQLLEALDGGGVRLGDQQAAAVLHLVALHALAGLPDVGVAQAAGENNFVRVHGVLSFPY